MRTVYGRSEEMYGVRHVRRRTGRCRQEGSDAFGRREKQRLIQLLVCVLIFAVAFVGKGVFPQRMETWKDSAATVLRSNTDFKSAFVGLGRAISDGEPVLDTLGDLWIQAFNGESITVIQGELSPIYRDECALLGSHLSIKEMLAKQLGCTLQTAQVAIVETTGWEVREDASQPALLEATPKVVYNGPALPDGCTMEKLQLNLKKTTTPVVGEITSGFGYRDDPVDGENKFHYGIDVAADIGTPILAFADGVVDYIGESEIYGQYIQLCHDGGVTTFYAHCSKLCAQKGQTISMGDTIAKVGQTGKSTGPHLHFEIKRNGVFLDPQKYIDTL